MITLFKVGSEPMVASYPFQLGTASSTFSTLSVVIRFAGSREQRAGAHVQKRWLLVIRRVAEVLPNADHALYLRTRRTVALVQSLFRHLVLIGPK